MRNAFLFFYNVATRCQSCFTTQSIIGHELNCSSCGSKVTVSDSLPRYLLVDPMTLDHEIHTNCVICEVAHPATKYCLDCNQALCESVVESHKRYLIFSNHWVVKIEDLNQYHKTHPHLSSLGPKSCIQHNRPFEFLDLSSQAHNELLCSECLNGKHTSLVGLSDCASSSSSPLLLQKIDHIRELDSERTAHLAKLQEEEEKLHSRLKGLQESRDSVLSEIRRVFGSLHETLQTRQLELESEVEELAKSAGFSLSEERDRNAIWQGQLLKLGKCVEEINSISLTAPIPSPSPSFPFLKRSSTSSQPDISSSFSSIHSSFPHFLSPKALMIDACLLEDVLRNSLSSSRASSDLQSNIRDQLHFSIRMIPPRPPISSSSFSTSSSITPSSNQEDEENALFHHILSMFYMTTSTSSLYFHSDWSKNNVYFVTSFFSKENANHPYGLTYSPDSKLFYVCDNENSRIQVFRNHPQAEWEGRLEIEYLSPLGSPDSSLPLNPSYTVPPLLLRPTGICYHDGQLFIVDHNNHHIQVWRAEDGSFLRMIGTGSAGDAVGQFYHPFGCTVYQNHLFVSDQDNNRIQKLSLLDYKVVKVIGSEGRRLSPRELAVFNGKLYVVDYSNHQISLFDPESGAALCVIGPSLLNDGKITSPMGLLFSHNLMFVSSDRRISVFDSDHNYLYSFGPNGSEAGQIFFPKGMVMVNDRLFVCDSFNHRVQVFEQKLD